MKELETGVRLIFWNNHPHRSSALRLNISGVCARLFILHLQVYSMHIDSVEIQFCYNSIFASVAGIDFENLEL